MSGFGGGLFRQAAANPDAMYQALSMGLGAEWLVVVITVLWLLFLHWLIVREPKHNPYQEIDELLEELRKENDADRHGS
jgi:hypothetical protein